MVTVDIKGLLSLMSESLQQHIHSSWLHWNDSNHSYHSPKHTLTNQPSAASIWITSH